MNVSDVSEDFGSLLSSGMKKMRDVRRSILNFIRERGQATVAELAESVGLSPVSVHYHLNRMERDGLVKAEPLRQGVGRPKYVFTLADAAMELFPQSNHRLADRLLDALQTQLTEQQIQAIFNRMVEDIAAEHDDSFKTKPLEDKIEALVAMLGEEGFFSRVERVGQDFRVTQCGCPYQYVAARHPNVCAIDLQLMSATLGTDVERGSWMLKGDSVCTFHVRASSANP